MTERDKEPDLEGHASESDAAVDSCPEPAPAGTKPGAPAAGAVPPAGKRKPWLLALAIVLSIVGFVGFVWLFVRDFNIYWLILSPVIIALYQIPAVFFYWLYKRSGIRTPPAAACSETPEP